MAFDDLLSGVEGLLVNAGEEARKFTHFRPGDTWGTGMPSSRLRLPDRRGAPIDISGLPPDTAEVVGGLTRWHSVLGKAMEPALAPATMAAVGFPAAALLGAGYAEPETSGFRLTEDTGLTDPSATFATTSRVGRMLSHAAPGFDEQGLPDNRGPWRKLANEIVGQATNKGAGFLEVAGNHLVENLPSFRLYRQESGDEQAAVKAAAMVASQIEFLDEWAGFDFEGDSAALVLREWHNLIRSGEGNADVAMDGILKVAQALEWVQHPELVIAPAVGLSYMNLDDDQAVVGLRVLQYPQVGAEELTPEDVAARLAAAEAIHPSGLIEPLVDNVRFLLEDAVGGPSEHPDEFFEMWRQDGTPRSLNDVGHIAGVDGAPSIAQMRRAIEIVASESGVIAGQQVTPEEINGIVFDVAAEHDFVTPGVMFDLITGSDIPSMENMLQADVGTDFTRYRSRPGQLTLQPTVPDPGKAITVTVEAASDGTFKVMSEDGSSTFRNRAVGFLTHNGRQATVPVQPRRVEDTKVEFSRLSAEGAVGQLWELDVTASHPAFGEGPQLMVSMPSSSDEQGNEHAQRILAAIEREGGTVRSRALPGHLASRPGPEGEIVEVPQRTHAVSFDTVADLHRVAAAAANAQSRLAAVLDENVDLRFYVNTPMDAPPGTVQRWETFTADKWGRLSAVQSIDGERHRTDQIPHYELEGRAMGGESQPMAPTALQSIDGSMPWEDGDTIYMVVPPYGEQRSPTFSHLREDIQDDPSWVVTMVRQANGNIAVRLPPDEDGMVSTMQAKQAHELLSALGRRQISMGVSDE